MRRKGSLFKRIKPDHELAETIKLHLQCLRLHACRTRALLPADPDTSPSCPHAGQVRPHNACAASCPGC